MRCLDVLAGPATGQPPYLVGVLEGEGIGPAVVGAALRLLERLEEVTGTPFATRVGGPIGKQAEELHGTALTEEVAQFVAQVLDEGGAVLAGAGGGRFVYDLRRRLNLFVKLNPIAGTGFDILVVRDNLEGLYHCHERTSQQEVECRFVYRTETVERLLTAAARLARARSGHLAVIVKDAGIPQLSAMWRREAERLEVPKLEVLDVDYAVYRMLRHPESLDVVASPNCFGDILSDLGGLLMESRGNTYGASFRPDGGGVYQTNHGAAFDLAGGDQANPLGQIAALAMMLHESFGLAREAELVRDAVRKVRSHGIGTADLPGSRRTVGTREMTELVCTALERQPVPG